MKKIILLFGCFAFMLTNIVAQETHVINISGTSFSPSVLNIQVDDTVQFNGDESHPVLEVSESTWNSNGNTALAGGFSFSDGTGKIMLDSPKTHYYICENHYAMGMKGKIIVSATTNLELPNLFSTIKLYPNPLNQDRITIDGFPGDNLSVRVKIFDLNGMSRFNTISTTQNRSLIIDSESIPSGIYFLQIEYNNALNNYKLIKIK